MMPYLAVWFRAFSIVTITACNVVNVTRGRWIAMFLSGGCLSAIWWGNARTAAHSHLPGARWAYAFGAACGTVTGAVIGGLL